MIAVTFFSKHKKDYVLFEFEFSSDINLILGLEGKCVKNLTIQNGVVIGEIGGSVERCFNIG